MTPAEPARLRAGRARAGMQLKSSTRWTSPLAAVAPPPPCPRSGLGSAAPMAPANQAAQVAMLSSVCAPSR